MQVKKIFFLSKKKILSYNHALPFLYLRWVTEWWGSFEGLRIEERFFISDSALLVFYNRQWGNAMRYIAINVEALKSSGLRNAERFFFSYSAHTTSSSTVKNTQCGTLSLMRKLWTVEDWGMFLLLWICYSCLIQRPVRRTPGAGAYILNNGQKIMPQWSSIV